MKLVMRFEFNDEERRRIAWYMPFVNENHEVTEIASAHLCAEFIREAIKNEWLRLEDEETTEEVFDKRK